MPGKKRLRMRGVKHSTKRLEDELLERSRALSDNPGLLRPQCAGGCRKCIFDKPFKAIDSLQKIKNNPDALIKEASKFGGDDLVRAYAGTVSLAAAGTVPMLGTANLGGEKVSYAVRGTVGADKLIGCQYYTDPKIRILLYNQMIKKHKLHLYSFGDEVVCSDDPNMPEDYLYDTFWETPYEFPDDGLACGHDTSAVLELRIKSLDQCIRICENCARDVSTVQYLISRLSAVNPMDDIEVRVRHKFHSEGEKDYVEIKDDLLKRYMSGELKDNTLISTVKRTKLGDLKEADTATYIIGTKNYGSDLDAFLKDISGEDSEMDTIKKFLSSNNRAVVVKTGRSVEVLSALWENDWRELVTIHTDRETLEKVGDVSKGQPMNVLNMAHDIFVSADVVASLPEFKRPGPVTTIADSLAKAAKVGGLQMLTKVAERTGMKDSRSRSVTASFLKAMGATEMPMKLSKDEAEFADYLVPFAKNVIASSGEKYREDMNTLLTAASSGEKV